LDAVKLWNKRAHWDALKEELKEWHKRLINPNVKIVHSGEAADTVRKNIAEQILALMAKIEGENNE